MHFGTEIKSFFLMSGPSDYVFLSTDDCSTTFHTRQENAADLAHCDIRTAEAIPHRRRAPLELAPVITELAQDLYNFAQWNLDPDSYRDAFYVRIHEKYPPH